MRLYEIDDTDRMWAKLNGINLNIDDQYDIVIDILNILLNLKSAHRTHQLLPTVDIFCELLEKIIDTSFADDITTTELKDKATQMLSTIINLKNQL